MKVWRINLKTAADGVDPRAFCFNKGIVGVGWPHDGAESLTWDEYRKNVKYKNESNWKAALRALHDRMEIDDLVWTRDRKGIYWLGRITGPWEYRGKPEYRQADVVNVRTCDWVRVGVEDTPPGRVANSFRGRTLQRSKGKGVHQFSKLTYNRLADEQYYELERVDADIFSLLHPDDIEDLVALYLQERGYRLIPSTAKKGTPRYEFVLRNEADGRKAVVQAKVSDTLSVRDYEDDADVDEVFLFSARGGYRGGSSKHVHCLDPAEIRAFIHQNRHVMPDKVRTWLDIAEEMSS